MGPSFDRRWRTFARLLLLAAPALGSTAFGQWTPQASATKERLRGLAVVNSKVIWASGNHGTVVRTKDGGITWKPATVPGAQDLDFRDVHAIDDRTALLLSIGEGEKSRVYQTSDGGNTWAIRFQNRDPKVFLDAVAFWDDRHGIALGDPADGHFTILTTGDGGLSWKRSAHAQMPPAAPGEGAFAASGTCLVVQGERNVWFGTGGAGVSRVFRSNDRGQSWSVHATPIPADNASSGIFSLAFRDHDEGIAVGGDYKQASGSKNVVARTRDGGRTWTLPRGPGPGGYRSAVVYVPGTARPTLIVVGPTGSDVSTDGGESWSQLGAIGFHAVGFARVTDAGWAVGDAGLIARFRGNLVPRR
jgi:photosystem II stability/assembly factor-like uncharacterized protein